MNTQPLNQNLLQGFKTIDGRVFVKFENLVSGFGVTYDAVHKGTVRNRKGANSWENIPDEKDGRVKWIALDTIPPATAYKHQLPTCVQVQESLKGANTNNLFQKLTRLRPMLSDSERDLLFNHQVTRQKLDCSLEEVITKSLYTLPEAEKQKIAEAARWLKLLSNPTLLTKKGLKQLDSAIESREHFFELCLKAMQQDGEKLLPNSTRRLQQKIKEYQEQGISCLFSARFGNTNANKLNDYQAAFLTRLACNPRKPNFNIIHRMYTEEATIKGWQTISLGTVKNYLNHPEVMPVWYYAQHGFAAWKERYEYTMLLQAPIFREALWNSDGTKVNLYYRNGSGYAAKLNCYIVSDVYSEKILGWSIGDHSENTNDISTALRMAIETAGNQLPLQFLYDGSSANRSFFENRYTGMHFKAAPNNGQSKPIESLFRRLQQKVMAAFPNFTGQNITATSKRSHINIDALPKPELLPTKDQAIQQAILQFNIWNNMSGPKGESPNELYAKSVNPEPRSLSNQDFISLFYEFRERPVTYRRNGITTTISGNTYHYEVLDNEGNPDIDFHCTRVGEEFYLRIDPLNPADGAALYVKPNGEALRFVAFAYSRERMPRALCDFQPDTKGKLDVRLQAKKKGANRVMDTVTSLEQNIDLAERLGLGAGILPKELMGETEAAWYVEVAQNTLGHISKPRKEAQFIDADTQQRLLKARALEEFAAKQYL